MPQLTQMSLSLLLFAALMTGCATTERGEFAGDDTEDLQAAVTGPVNDIGFNDIEIPEYLANMGNPYATQPSTCSALNSEVARLNSLLGADLNIAEDEDARKEQNRLNATRNTVGSVLIPFRGVVRAISGASKNERLAREAYERGLVRRAYLKGRAEVLGC